MNGASAPAPRIPPAGLAFALPLPSTQQIRPPCRTWFTRSFSEQPRPQTSPHRRPSRTERLKDPGLQVPSNLSNSDCVPGTRRISNTWRPGPSVLCLTNSSFSFEAPFQCHNLRGRPRPPPPTWLLPSHFAHLFTTLTGRAKTRVSFQLICYLLYLQTYYTKAEMVSVLLGPVSQELGQHPAEKRHLSHHVLLGRQPLCRLPGGAA